MPASVGSLDLDAKSLASEYTLTVRVKRIKQWRWRLTVGMWLIGLITRLMWLEKIKLKEDDI